MTGDARVHVRISQPGALQPDLEGPTLQLGPSVDSPSDSDVESQDAEPDSAVRRARASAALAAADLPRMGVASRIAKRALDVTGATVGLVVLSPLFFGVAVAIRLSDGHEALFRQRRAGLDGRPFTIAKFRTMRIGADAQRAELRAASANEVDGGAAFKMANDPRVTRVGGFLRRTSIDELPQLWNVLKGEMSLVGPRPHPYDDLQGYAAWHFARLSVKPGLTGLWQIRGRSETEFDRWVAYDLEYIRNQSVVEDIRILLATIPAVFRQTGR